MNSMLEAAKKMGFSDNDSRVLVSSTFVFFFQAEDGTRDGRVTGVQTCALPIWQAVRSALSQTTAHSRRMGEASSSGTRTGEPPPAGKSASTTATRAVRDISSQRAPEPRSEERRIGKERRARWWQGDKNNYYAHT